MMNFGFKRPIAENKSTVGNAIGNKPSVKINYSKIKKIVMECELNQKDELCKKELESIGVNWIEENKQ